MPGAQENHKRGATEFATLWIVRRDGHKDELIEVTDQMILAGIRALPYLPLETLGSLEEATLVRQVYVAMHSHAAPTDRPKNSLSRPERSGSLNDKRRVVD
jgi:hypothetical protein